MYRGGCAVVLALGGRGVVHGCRRLCAGACALCCVGAAALFGLFCAGCGTGCGAAAAKALRGYLGRFAAMLCRISTGAKFLHAIKPARIRLESILNASNKGTLKNAKTRLKR